MDSKIDQMFKNSNCFFLIWSDGHFKGLPALNIYYVYPITKMIASIKDKYKNENEPVIILQIYLLRYFWKNVCPFHVEPSIFPKTENEWACKLHCIFDFAGQRWLDVIDCLWIQVENVFEFHRVFCHWLWWYDWAKKPKWKFHQHWPERLYCYFIRRHIEFSMSICKQQKNTSFNFKVADSKPSSSQCQYLLRMLIRTPRAIWMFDFVGDFNRVDMFNWWNAYATLCTWLQVTTWKMVSLLRFSDIARVYFSLEFADDAITQ